MNMNMISGVDKLYEMLLLEAKTPEQIKDLYRHQFVKLKGVPEKILDRIFDIDPTSKKSFTKWVLLQYNGNEELIRDILNDDTLKYLFNYFKERTGNGLKIMDYTIKEAIEMLPYEEKILKPKPEGWENDPEYDYEIKFETDEWVIAVPHTYEASCYLAQGCKWCTAEGYGYSDYRFNHYTSEGPLWINFDKRKSEVCPMDNKEYPYTRYQFLFEKNELMDSRNKRINLEKANIPEDVIKFYGDVNEEYSEILEIANSDEENWEIYQEERMNTSILVKEWDYEYLGLLYEQKDNDYHVDEEHDITYLYGNGDYGDPINYDEYDRENYLYKDFEDFPLILLKNKRSEINAYFHNYTYWEDICDIDKYYEIEGYYGKIVILVDNRNNIFFITKDRNFQFNGGKRIISNIKVLTPDFELPDFYDDEIFIQFDYDNGFSGLYMLYDGNTELYGEFRIIKDKCDGDEFTFHNENGNIFIHALYRDYPLSNKKFSNFLEEDFSFFEKLKCQNNIFICQENVSNLFVLYDADNKKILTDYFLRYEEVTDNLLYIEERGEDNNVYFYDLEKKEINFDKFYEIKILNSLRKTFLCVYMHREHGNFMACVFYALENFKTDFFNLYNILSSNVVLLANDKNEVYIYNVKEKEYKDCIIVEKNNHRKVGFDYVVCLCKKDNKLYLYSLLNGEKIFEVGGLDFKLINNKTFFIVMPNKKYSFFNSEIGLLFEDGFDEVITCDYRYDINIAIAKKDFKYFILNEKGEIISPEIDSTYIEDINLVGENGVRMNIIYNNEKYKVIYNTLQNKINNILNRKTLKYVDESLYGEFYSLLFPQQKNEISENFKKMLDRINILF